MEKEKVVLHVHTKYPEDAHTREDYLKIATLEKILKQAKVKKIRLIGITNTRDNLERIIREYNNKEKEIEKIDNSLYISHQSKIYLWRGYEWHKSGKNQGHVLLLGINEEKPIDKEINKYHNIEDIIKYGNDKEFLVVLDHPLAMLAGGVKEEKFRELLRKREEGLLDFACSNKVVCHHKSIT